ncbi:MAG: hypothetical protein M1123_01790 [Candidatus Thermoplasmatota archaeon]|jgi:hypothetical protein|nr:hypothetical protein [Candidatus Thermoplasmatota archaeon]
MTMMTHLTKGSKYRIASASSTEENIISEGILEGFLTMGEESAILLNIGNNKTDKLRIIPVSTILYIDVIVQNEEKENNDKGNLNYIS